MNIYRIGVNKHYIYGDSIIRNFWKFIHKFIINLLIIN